MRRWIVAAACLATVGCVERFQTDFESDVAGDPPLAAPPGPPAGDSLTYGGDVVIVSTTALEGAQALRLRGPAGDATPAAYAHTVPIRAAGDRINAAWSGRLSAGAQARIEVIADFSDVLLYVDFWAPIVYVNGNSVGTYTPGGVQTAVLGMFPGNDMYSLVVAGDAEMDDGAAEGVVLNPEAFPASHLTLAFRLSEGGVNHSFWVDDILVSQPD